MSIDQAKEMSPKRALGFQARAVMVVMIAMHLACCVHSQVVLLSKVDLCGGLLIIELIIEILIMMRIFTHQ